jgi:hypothetical protein
VGELSFLLKQMLVRPRQACGEFRQHTVFALYGGKNGVPGKIARRGEAKLRQLKVRIFS